MPIGDKSYEVTYRKRGKDKPLLKTYLVGFNRKQVLSDIYRRGYIPVTVKETSWAWGRPEKKIKM